ncbi:PTS sugar transporter subunit IIA [Candidatus Enterococcus ferrettii]|uniref:PTS system, N-acetylgalactosamine-specific IIA component n=1 Tax=Candidatus Enterococcus ferrettii TaxID=2815324 RepID=A0ABV0EPE6_9ENTE|nr:PTS fructose transporter subunit IIA [Enterococcus sp. 665A]MBO1343145.1 PTS fructose transporter subunit IIA [Enterococcus sp. 665A]
MMKYVLLVSHGTFAEGLKNAVEMMASKRGDFKAVGLEEDMQVADFRKKFSLILQEIKKEDKILLFCDILSGSPFTNAIDLINKKDMINNSLIVSGMNMPVVLNTLLTKDGKNLEEIHQDINDLKSTTIDIFHHVDNVEEEEAL